MKEEGRINQKSKVPFGKPVQRRRNCSAFGPVERDETEGGRKKEEGRINPKCKVPFGKLRPEKEE